MHGLEGQHESERLTRGVSLDQVDGAVGEEGGGVAAHRLKRVAVVVVEVEVSTGGVSAVVFAPAQVSVVGREPAGQRMVAHVLESQMPLAAGGWVVVVMSKTK